MYIGIASKLIIGAIGVFILVRIMGKKAMSELTAFDLIYVLLLGATVEESIYDDKVTILHAIFAIVIWGIFVYVIEKALQNTDKLSTLIQGEPSILIYKGKLNRLEMKRNFFDIEQLRSMLRQNGVYSIHEVNYAILEVNGSLTVITKDEEKVPTFLLIEFGTIQSKTLKGLDKDEAWLRKELAAKGYDKIKDIVYAEWNPQEQDLTAEGYNDTFSEKIYIDD